jgi:broad specificity phosphatase PhoE
VAVFYLIRHAHNSFVDKGIAGRLSDIHLTAEGQRQAQTIAELLSAAPVSRIVCSPRERTRETAAPLASRKGLEVEIVDGLDEIDFGQWQGASFDELQGDRDWYRFNHFRSNARIPGGEMISETQVRMVSALNTLCAEEPNGHIAVFGHGDPLRLGLAYFAGIPVDMMLRLEISLASISVLELTEDFARISCINHTASGPAMPS